MFQFLIGTLKTSLLLLVFLYLPIVSIPHRYSKNVYWKHGKGCLYSEFQFLIGTLKTVVKVISNYEYEKFQFLIGTLKTQYKANDKVWNPLVSIPHRYSKNFLPCPTILWPYSKFQFLIGTLKTSRHEKEIKQVLFVSIPHRYSKNYVIVAIKAMALLGFNSS